MHPETRSHAFSSFFSSFRNRQSVPWAMSCCGVDLIIPTSCRRRAWKRSVSSGFASRQRLYGSSSSPQARSRSAVS